MRNLNFENSEAGDISWRRPVLRGARALHRTAGDGKKRPASALRRDAWHPQLRRVRRDRSVVYDMDNGHKFVKRIPTFDLAAGEAPENVKGIAASAKTGRVYVSTIKRLGAFDLTTGSRVWVRDVRGRRRSHGALAGREDPLLPSLEGPHWHAIDAMSGDVLKKIVTDSGAHNTIYGPGWPARVSGRTASRRCSPSPIRSTHTVVGGVGPFSAPVRPFTINAKRDAVLRQRQRPARLRSRRHQDRQGAAPREGHGLRKGPGEAARLPEPRHRADAGREGALAGRRRQQQSAHLRRDGDAAEADRHHRGPRSARLDHVQPRRPLRLPVDRRRSSTPRRRR